MARTIVNKHFDESSKITREQFHENIDYAKGEIIISNEENPSIWVLDANGEVKQITGVGGNDNGNGGSQGGVSSDELNALEKKITDAYVKADEVVISGVTKGYTDADARLKNELLGANDTFKQEVNMTVSKIDQAYKAADATITQSITTTKEDILKHTVNGIELKQNPVLDATHISVGTYSELVLDDIAKENVITNDTAQVAIKKVENMNIASSLAFAAGLNDVNRKVESLFENELVVSESLNDLNDRLVVIEAFKIDELITKIAELEAKVAKLEGNTDVTE